MLAVMDGGWSVLMVVFARAAAKHLLVLAEHPPAAQYRGKERHPAVVGCWVSQALPCSLGPEGMRLRSPPGQVGDSSSVLP